MSVQVIMRNRASEYAVLPWAEYQALLQAAIESGECEPDDVTLHSLGHVLDVSNWEQSL